MRQENFTKQMRVSETMGQYTKLGFSLENKEKRPFWIKKQQVEIRITGEKEGFIKRKERCCMASQKKPGITSSKAMLNFKQNKEIPFILLDQESCEVLDVQVPISRRQTRLLQSVCVFMVMCLGTKLSHKFNHQQSIASCPRRNQEVAVTSFFILSFSFSIIFLSLGRTFGCLQVVGLGRHLPHSQKEAEGIKKETQKGE